MNDALSRIRLEYEDFQWKYPGSINGKPFDTIGEARTVRIIYDDRTIYSVEDPEFIFYKNLEHYPKLAVVNDSTYLYIFEHNLGEPEGTELAGVLFTAHRHIGTFFRDAEDAGIDMSKDYLGKTLLYQLQDTVNELLAEYD